MVVLITYPHEVCFFIANTIYSGFNWNTKKFMWSEQETKILKDLWKKGLTASQIAALISGCHAFFMFKTFLSFEIFGFTKSC